MQNPGIVCKGVTKDYGDIAALKGIDLSIDAGDFLSLFGPNGAGKTTLMKILCGLTRPTNGSASVAGADVGDPEVRQKVGVISHKSFIYENLTAKENIVFYAELYCVEDPRKRADALLEMVELSERGDDLAHTFSRGMMQRLSIARALVADPDFVFLDEPFTGLDQHSTELFKGLLKNLHGKRKTMIMVSHNIDIGIEIGTRAVILRKGEKVFDTTTDGVSADEFKKIYSQKVGG